MQRTPLPTRASQSRLKQSSVRIASLLPGLTDIVTELEESSCLVAVTHECATTGPTPCVTNNIISVEELESTQIAAGWNAAFSLQHSMKELLTTHTCSFYRVNIPSLVRAQPTVLLTHLKPPKTELDPSENELKYALQSIIPGLEVVSASPRNLTDIYNLYAKIGQILNSPAKAMSCVTDTKATLRKIRATVNSKLSNEKTRPRVAVVQWTDPLYLAGDWIPSAVEVSARLDGFVRTGFPSVRATPSLLKQVDIIIFALCGLSMDASVRLIKRFYEMNEELPNPSKVKYIVADAINLFSRPSLSSIVNTSKVIAEIVMDSPEFGMRGRMWHEWKPT
ncbi:unnamed protein product [Agarophyton chilense]